MKAGRSHLLWPAGLAALGALWYASESLRHRREGGHGYDLVGEVDVGSPEFLHAAEALTGAPISTGNDLELLINGDRIFPAFLDTIRSAQRSVNLLTYVYWRGDIAREVAGTLCAKAREGVEVNVLLDAVGTAKMQSDLIDQMSDAGVTVSKFRPVKPYAIRRVTNRTHRKLLVADGRVGMIGGVGIAEEWTGDAHDPDHWRDTHLRVRGPIVRGLQGAFAENWLEATGDVLIDGERYLPELAAEDGGWPMQLVRSAAGVGDTNVEALYFLAIASASRSLDLTAAYFAPRPAFNQALTLAAERGVAVRVLVPGRHIDKPFVRVAGRRSYDELLEAGVRIFEYGPTMLHAKSLVVDGAWASVGSVNFDNRSFQLHDEATLCVQSDELARALTEALEADLAVSEEILLDRWRRRPRAQRAREAALTLARREL
ncbi:MAG TPA: phospholipase D-like domain-containing protein [Solirubrobacteraceae bacterium]|nr:phospholipase D-like domain-containing protein [Solirubrobacteraceae bacterium]